ncbi:MAG: hypothetical protein EBS86_15550 [Crocinitomicaceae bacterium]|nr:hypothetical protein [Crocinitomicaceae bacterium]
MNKRLYIITGAPDVRKSSVIRALTGIRDTKSFQIQFQEGVRKTHVMATSPNELDSMGFDNGMSPQQLIEYLKNLNEDITAAIIPIRSINPKYNLPVASVYIQELVNAGFEIAEVAMFNDAIPLPNGVQGTVLMSNQNIPSNLTASKLRKIWGII